MTATVLDQLSPFRRATTSADDEQHGTGGDPGPGFGSTTHMHDNISAGKDAPGHAARQSWSDERFSRRAAPSFAAALVVIAPVIPTIGAVATFVAYVGGPTLSGWYGLQGSVLLGVGATLLLGLVAICLHRSFFTTAEQAHARSFAEVRRRVDGLATQLRVLRPASTDEVPVSQRLAFEEAANHCRALERDLLQSGPQWTTGTGYVDALTRLHRAEEALILVQPIPDVLAGATFDELRISGSTVASRARLLVLLRTAVQALRPTASAFLSEAVSDDRRRTAHPGRTDASAATGEPADAPSEAQGKRSARRSRRPPTVEAEARMVLREVRRALNDFRNESRARLIRSRWRLTGSMTVTGVITYVLLTVAITLRHGQAVGLDDPIVAAAVIYLLGATIGLFNRLHVESKSAAAGEDYGLSCTRLLLTPMLSGLAAVGGVLITGMLSGIIDVNAITPTPALAASLTSALSNGGPGTPITRMALGLGDVFNLRAYPFALVLAAMFGLTPQTLLTRLHRASEQSLDDLKRTAVSRSSGGIPSGLSAGDGDERLRDNVVTERNEP